MKNGFSLIEVLVALLIIVIMFMGIMKISILSLRANAYSEALTHASVLGHTKLVHLKGQGIECRELRPEWHQDPLNPIISNSIRFYRFWQVHEMAAGKRVEMYTAWVDPVRREQGAPVSAADMRSGNWPHIVMTDIFLRE